jgi:hypothetical protein
MADLVTVVATVTEVNTSLILIWFVCFLTLLRLLLVRVNSGISAAELVLLPPHMFVPPSRHTNWTKQGKQLLICINVNRITNMPNFIEFSPAISEFRAFRRTDLYINVHLIDTQFIPRAPLPDRLPRVHYDTHHNFMLFMIKAFDVFRGIPWRVDGIRELCWHKKLNTLQFNAQLCLSGTNMACRSASLSRYNRILHYSGVRVSNLQSAVQFHLKFHYHFCLFVYCTMLGVLDHFLPPVWRVTPLKTPFRLLIGFITISHT